MASIVALHIGEYNPTTEAFIHYVTKYTSFNLTLLTDKVTRKFKSSRVEERLLPDQVLTNTQQLLMIANRLEVIGDINILTSYFIKSFLFMYFYYEAQSEDIIFMDTDLLIRSENWQQSILEAFQDLKSQNKHFAAAYDTFDPFYSRLQSGFSLLSEANKKLVARKILDLDYYNSGLSLFVAHEKRECSLDFIEDLKQISEGTKVELFSRRNSFYVLWGDQEIFNLLISIHQEHFLSLPAKVNTLASVVHSTSLHPHEFLFGGVEAMPYILTAEGLVSQFPLEKPSYSFLEFVESAEAIHWIGHTKYKIGALFKKGVRFSHEELVQHGDPSQRLAILRMLKTFGKKGFSSDEITSRDHLFLLYIMIRDALRTREDI